MMCDFLPKGLALPEKYKTLSVPACTWLIFTAENGEVQALYKRIWSEFLPSCKYEIAESPQFEMYFGLARHENGVAEIWLPVKEK